MLCSNCGINDANFHYKHISGGKMTQVHLCSDCAKRLGYIKENESIFSLPNFFGDFLSTPKTVQTREKCPSCGTSFDTVRRTGFVGCDKCYETFKNLIEAMLGKIQPSTSHKANQKATIKEDIEKSPLEKYKEELKTAIEKENYEQAAVLRDKIKALESEGVENDG